MATRNLEDALTTATTERAGVVMLAEDGESDAAKAVAANDARLAAGGVLAAFRAALTSNYSPGNGSGGASDAKLAMATEVLDIGGYYDHTTNYRWTPPAGLVAISIQVAATSTDTNGLWAYVRKNGTAKISFIGSRLSASNPHGFAAPMVVDQANGTDYYEVFCGRWQAGTFIGSASEVERTQWSGVCYALEA